MDTFGSMSDADKQLAKSAGLNLGTTDATCYTPKSFLKEFRYTAEFVSETGPAFKDVGPTVVLVYGLPTGVSASGAVV